MNSKRRNEGRVILIISLSSIVLWLIIAVPIFPGATLLQSLNYNLVDLDLFCREVSSEDAEGMRLMNQPLTFLEDGSYASCSMRFVIDTKMAIIFSFVFSVYGLLVFLGHAPGLTEVWNKLKHQDKS